MSAALVRAGNPFTPLLAVSQGVLRLRVQPGAPTPPELGDEAARIGATLRREPGGDADTLVVEVSHATVDAFGALHLVADFGRALAPFSRPLSPPAETRWTSPNGFACCQALRQARPASSPERTATQRVLAALGPVFADARVTHVSIVVAQDDLKALSRADYLGNSFIPVELPLATAIERAALPRQEWLALLRRDSQRVLRIATRRAAQLGFGAQVMISAIGDLARLGWAAPAHVDPRTLAIASTPATDGIANLLWWGRGDAQALTVCARAAHPLVARQEALFAAWQEALLDGG